MRYLAALGAFLTACGPEPVPEAAPAPDPPVEAPAAPEPEPVPLTGPGCDPGRSGHCMYPENHLKRGGPYTFVWKAPDPEPPDPELSDEALVALAKHGGTLKWHTPATTSSGTGQWEYRPHSDCGVGLDQYDQSATIAVILAASEADNMCRICGPMHKGRFLNRKGPRMAGCTCEEWDLIDELYDATACRLGRDGFARGEGYWCNGMGGYHCDDELRAEEALEAARQAPDLTSRWRKGSHGSTSPGQGPRAAHPHFARGSPQKAQTQPHTPR